MLQLGGGRRSSTALHNSTSQPDTASPAPTSEAHMSQVGGQPVLDQPMDNRFSKDQLLDIYRSQHASDFPTKDVSSLYVNGWDPGHSNGANGRGWGKSGDGRDTHGPHICWDENGSVPLMSLQEMTDLEKAVSCFAIPLPVNSCLRSVGVLWRCQLTTKTATTELEQRFQCTRARSKWSQVISIPWTESRCVWAFFASFEQTQYSSTANWRFNHRSRVSSWHWEILER